MSGVLRCAVLILDRLSATAACKKPTAYRVFFYPSRHERNLIRTGRVGTIDRLEQGTNSRREFTFVLRAPG